MTTNTSRCYYYTMNISIYLIQFFLQRRCLKGIEPTLTMPCWFSEQNLLTNRTGSSPFTSNESWTVLPSVVVGSVVRASLAEGDNEQLRMVMLSTRRLDRRVRGLVMWLGRIGAPFQIWQMPLNKNSLFSLVYKIMMFHILYIHPK